MGYKGFRANLDAWREGNATQGDVEAALREELTADPRLIPATRSLIETYRQAGHIPGPFAKHLMGIESGRAVPPTAAENTLHVVPSVRTATSTGAGEAPADRPALQPAPFCGYVPRVSTAAPKLPPADVVDLPSRSTAAGAVQPAAPSAVPVAPEPRPVDAQAFGDGMPPKQRPVKLLLVGAAALVLVLIAAVLLTTSLLDRRRAESIESILVSPDPKVTDDGVAQLSRADENTRDAVLGMEGMKAKVRAVFERQARSAFDPQQNRYDYSRARAILERAAWLLPDDEPLRLNKQSLEKTRRLELNLLDKAFEMALAAHDLQDSGPSSLLAVRQIIAALEPSDPLLQDSRVPLAFRDAAAAALAKSDLDRADRLVHDGLSIAPGNPALVDVADRVRRERERRAVVARSRPPTVF